MRSFLFAAATLGLACAAAPLLVLASGNATAPAVDHDHAGEAHADEGDAHAGHNHFAVGGECKPDDLAALSAAYNLPLRIASIFILLFVSAVGVYTTYLAHRFPRLRIPPGFLFGSRHFGSGVILATGFIHMLPAAMGALAHPCLAAATEVYSAWAPLLIMVAALAMHAVEFIAGEVGRRRQRVIDSEAVSAEDPLLDPAANDHDHDHDHDHTATANAAVLSADVTCPEPVTYASFTPGSRKSSVVPAEAARRSRAASHVDCHEMAVVVANVPRAHHQHDKTCEEEEHCSHDDPSPSAVQCNVAEVTGLAVHHHTGHHCHNDTALLLLDPPGTATARQRIATYILEFGIALHSVLIGLAIGVAGEEFLPLLIAVLFHQLFEGLALGQRIGQVTPKDKVMRAVLMAGFFAITAPIGVAIGIGVRQQFLPSDPGMLVVQGVLDSISAGILLYTAFVHLLGEDIINSTQFQGVPSRYKVIGFVCLWTGAAVMAIIGKWA